MSSTTASDRRHYSRILFDAPSVLHQEQKEWPATLLDISLRGVLVKTPDNFDGDVKAPFEIIINLSSDGESIVMALQLVHVEPGKLGFRCDYIDLDSITHLKRLVELNLGDSESLNRELSALVSQHNS